MVRVSMLALCWTWNTVIWSAFTYRSGKRAGRFHCRWDELWIVWRVMIITQLNSQFMPQFDLEWGCCCCSVQQRIWCILKPMCWLLGWRWHFIRRIRDFVVYGLVVCIQFLGGRLDLDAIDPDFQEFSWRWWISRRWARLRGKCLWLVDRLWSCKHDFCSQHPLFK